MSVRIQFFTVVVPLARIRAIPGLEARLAEKYRGFSDEHLWSVSSMAPPSDIGADLESAGLVLREVVNGVRTWKDICVVDYYEGPTNPCPWLEVDMQAHVAWLRGTTPGPVVGPSPHEPMPIKLMPVPGGLVATAGPGGAGAAPVGQATSAAPSTPAAPAPHVARLLADAVANAQAISILYFVLSVGALGAVLLTDFHRWSAPARGFASATYHPHFAAVFLLVPIALTAYRLFLMATLGKDELFVHYRPVSLELQEGRVLGSIGLTIASIFLAGMEETSFWAPWIVMPIVAYMLCGWDSTIVTRGSYRASPLFRPTPIGHLQAGFLIVRGRGIRVALFYGRTPLRPLTQVATEVEAVDLAKHLFAAHGIPPALERARGK